jgi:hypothetical protein
MSENTTPEVKELEDGSAELPNTQAEEVVEIEDDVEEKDPAPEAQDNKETANENGSQDDVNTAREKIREERRTERKLKNDFKRKAEASERHLLVALKRQNEELAARLAAVENTSTAFKVAQADKSVEDQHMRVEWAKGELQKAITAGNAEAQAKLLDILTDEKAKLKEYTVFKDQQIKASKNPPTHIPTPHKEREVSLAKEWASKNGWYDPANRDFDSKIAKIIDEELSQEGWNAADPEYWEELTERCKERIPHRFGEARRSPVTANRSANETQARTQQPIRLSKARVDTLKEMGVWGTPDAKRYIDAYLAYDKQQRNS